MRYVATAYNGLTELNRELNRIFDGRRLSPLRSIEEDKNWFPQVDVTESEESFQIVADLPGVNPNDIEISLVNGVLTIKGKSDTTRDKKEDSFARKERHRGTFLRQFSLPDSVDAETISAKSAHGVLTVTIWKAAPPQPIKVVVETA